MQNDCFLKDNDYKWINKNFNIDLAGVFFFYGDWSLPGVICFTLVTKGGRCGSKKD